MSTAGYFDNRASYARYLNLSWQARQPIEDALDAYGAEKLFALWPLRRIGPAIRTDIADLALTWPSNDDPPIPLAVATKAQALGMLYVLEGSALGARVLVGRARLIGMNAAFGARHLARQIAMPHAWPNFLSNLEAVSLDTAEEAECIEAAIATFECFERG